jgi:uncharacterized damage-inducible protein DinB
MSWLEQIRTAYAYNEWANEKVIKAASQVSDEELLRERATSYSSIAAGLTHIVGVQEGWLSFLAGKQRPPRLETPAKNVIATLRPLFDASHRKLKDWTAGLEEADLDGTLTTTYQGKDYTYRPWQVLFHLANHGTQHRAEIGIALLALDASPGDLDADDFFFLDD